MKWVNQINKRLEEIAKDSPKDRLAKFSLLYKYIIFIGESLSGWLSWLMDPVILDCFTGEETEQLFQEFKQLTIKMLELDKNWTSRKAKTIQTKKMNYLRRKSPIYIR